jgi:hypothetical protein
MKTLLTRFRLIPLVVVLLAMVLGVALYGPALAGHGGAHRFVSGPVTYKQVVTRPGGVSFGVAPVYANIPGATMAIPIPANSSALINVRFTAESLCTGNTAGMKCSVRVLIGGAPAEPNEGDGSDFALDTTGGQDLEEGHAIERHLCVQNANATLRRTVTVLVQARVVGPPGALANFAIDDYSLAAERSDTCRPVELTIQ